MDMPANTTESVVRRHLQTFIEQRGPDAIVTDYEDDACLVTEGTVYRGRPAIRDFFAAFIESLPPGAIGEFALRSLRVERDLAYITWSAGPTLPLGTDTFVVRDGRIVLQTVALYRLQETARAA